MARRILLVDVDNTLVDASDEPIYDTVTALYEWNETYGTTWGVMIWSGGGDDYAHEWYTMMFSGLPFEWSAKDPKLVHAGDVLVDDGDAMIETMRKDAVARGWPVIYTPRQFAATWRERDWNESTEK